MAFNKENFYQEGNSQEYFFSRTNPLANAGNAEILRIKDCCCAGVSIELVTEIVYTTGEVTFSFSSPTSTIDTRYLKVVITDGNGNFATTVGTGTVSSLVVDVTGLNINTEWTINVVIEVGDNPGIECPCMKEFDILFNPFIGTIEIDTTTLGTQRIALLEGDNSTVVADGGAYSIGSFAAGGTTESFTVYVKNTGGMVLTVSSVSFTSDVAAFTLTPYGDVIYPTQSIAYSGTVDTSGVAGTYTGTITVNSDDSTNTAYTIDIDFTLV
jgi:hypothetical protein